MITHQRQGGGAWTVYSCVRWRSTQSHSHHPVIESSSHWVSELARRRATTIVGENPSPHRGSWADILSAREVYNKRQWWTTPSKQARTDLVIQLVLGQVAGHKQSVAVDRSIRTYTERSRVLEVREF